MGRTELRKVMGMPKPEERRQYASRNTRRTAGADPAAEPETDAELRSEAHIVIQVFSDDTFKMFLHPVTGGDYSKSALIGAKGYELLNELMQKLAKGE